MNLLLNAAATPSFAQEDMALLSVKFNSLAVVSTLAARAMITAACSLVTIDVT